MAHDLVFAATSLLNPPAMSSFYKNVRGMPRDLKNNSMHPPKILVKIGAYHDAATESLACTMNQSLN